MSDENGDDDVFLDDRTEKLKAPDVFNTLAVHKQKPGANCKAWESCTIRHAFVPRYPRSRLGVLYVPVRRGPAALVAGRDGMGFRDGPVDAMRICPEEHSACVFLCGLPRTRRVARRSIESHKKNLQCQCPLPGLLVMESFPCSHASSPISDVNGSVPVRQSLCGREKEFQQKLESEQARGVVVWYSATVDPDSSRILRWPRQCQQSKSNSGRTIETKTWVPSPQLVRLRKKGKNLDLDVRPLGHTCYVFCLS